MDGVRPEIGPESGDGLALSDASGGAAPAGRPCHDILDHAPLLYRSRAFAQILRQAEKAARSSVLIFLEGESGTGKGKLARFIHEMSHRSGRLIVWSAPETTESLLQSELMGYGKGAFTDARKPSPGLLLSAHRGTIVIDDVDKLPMGGQPALLRFLDDRKVRPVNAHEEIPVDVLVIATANRDVQVLARQDRYLPDLAFRLSRAVIRTPPLRERPEDIPVLAGYLAGEYGRAFGFPSAEILPDALEILTRHPWPANVRGLAGALETAFLRSETGRLDARTILDAIASPARESFDGELDRLKALPEEERKSEPVLRRCLEFFRWNRKQAAAHLGIPLRTFHRLTATFQLKRK